MPDYSFSSFKEITPDFLLSKGIKGVISDIDNTLAPYETEDATEEIKEWIKALNASGIKLAFISNNHPPRVERFNRDIGVPAFPDAGKPGTKYIFEAMKALGVKKEESAVLGDQLLTDSLAAHRAGLPMIFVPPIKDKTSLFFRFKRWLEKPYMKKFYKINNAEKQ